MNTDTESMNYIVDADIEEAGTLENYHRMRLPTTDLQRQIPLPNSPTVPLQSPEQPRIPAEYVCAYK